MLLRMVYQLHPAPLRSSQQSYFEKGALAGSQNGTVILMDLPGMNASWVSSEVMTFDTSLTSWTDSWYVLYPYEYFRDLSPGRINTAHQPSVTSLTAPLPSPPPTKPP